ncbi:hypothetical protein SISSUDRAFT_1048122 [Sistotremastrum suecicum HHB10207 ss-3]|uniref:F-box domain-containing protein n=1 Tax=Sistotremastrum suecicum HHB10207 ss-3 TaxID=1314776 RepID=A0A166CQH1_9AGAM|nr:hypothetical protein SISSUDRAFT_1048122 [Sistotremastrum suecicum HHB10207 ss-3]
MHIPSDICRLVAEAIRGPESHIRDENKTLAALSCVNKQWSSAVTPVLWSHLYFTDEVQDVEHFDRQLAQVSHFLEAPNSRYTKYTTSIVIGVRTPESWKILGETRAEAITSAIQSIISHSSRLKHLHSTCEQSWAPLLLPKISSIPIPNLETLYLNWQTLYLNREVYILQHSVTLDELDEFVRMFLCGVPNLQTLVLASSFWMPCWSLLKCHNLLPKLQSFKGPLPGIALFAPAHPLTAVKWTHSFPILTFCLRVYLGGLSKPFATVTCLSMENPRISLEGGALKELSHCFPALEHIDGFIMEDPEKFVALMSDDPERFAQYLPKLKTLILHGQSPFDETRLKDIDHFYNSTASAFASLRRLFPSIILATHLECENLESTTTMPPRFLKISYSFNEEGAVERQICVDRRDWHLEFPDDMF